MFIFTSFWVSPCTKTCVCVNIDIKKRSVVFFLFFFSPLNKCSLLPFSSIFQFGIPSILLHTLPLYCNSSWQAEINKPTEFIVTPYHIQLSFLSIFLSKAKKKNQDISYLVYLFDKDWWCLYGNVSNQLRII